MSISYQGPVVLIIMDGIGLSDTSVGNAVRTANTPTLDRCMTQYPMLKLKAHGTAVGLPSDDDMGNSEVGHNAIGAGQVYSQGAKLVTESLATKAMFDSVVWKELLGGAVQGGTLHFIGLLSDGNVHSHIDHLLIMLEQAKSEGVRRVRIHPLLDGRDVGETSALQYIDQLEGKLSELCDDITDYRIASGGGRMKVTMDRYFANWSMVELGWKTHVLGEGRLFSSATEAIETYRREIPGVIDQDLPAFVVGKDGKAIGTINDGDSVILFNFRGDRAQELTLAFESDESFVAFDRVRVPKVRYAGMLEYDGDLHIPKKFLVSPPLIRHTLGELLADKEIPQLAISETQKFGHVTYFFNGNRSSKFSEENEEYIEILSDIVPFEQRPWMKSADITDVIIEKILSNKHPFVRVNFPNGDMVGHTGIMESTIIGVESVDIALKRILPAIDQIGGMAIITADHGNAEEMFELSKDGSPKVDGTGRIKAKTSHSLNPVPCIFYDNTANRDQYTVRESDGFGLANIAATIADLLNVEPLACWNESMIRKS
ncbi:MAG: 2,3-bisphosphoglycerate-independent phosphoglycerate mutase [Clostridiaceae bacterium]|nr:2,3-bisphosphoglycerate-independent phosphoglycerate mutase [Oscillospiraceae bacterium]NLO62338.1 2,3-bisphosphoglycerate-independent phosphoglycerate mutase [Clostridiaceae bacterium]